MTDYKNKTKAELIKLATEKREALKNFRFGIAGSKTKNMREGRKIRREIAQLETQMKVVE